MTFKTDLLYNFEFSASRHEVEEIKSAVTAFTQEQVTKAIEHRNALKDEVLDSVKDGLYEHYLSIKPEETNVFLRKLHTLTKNEVTKNFKFMENAHSDLIGYVTNLIFNDVSTRTLYKGETHTIMEFIAWAKPEMPID